jgi:4-hydroxybenzoate polyprenyltransferase
MASWLIYIKERFPLPVYALLVGGISLSGNFSAAPGFRVGPSALSFMGLLGFFFILRLMDELKDYEKDLIVHPERPLPRGVLDAKKVAKQIPLFTAALFAYAVLSALLTSVTAGVLLAIVTGWLWLMYKEFYLGEWLAKRPLLYAISHQLILIPVCLFSVSCHSAEAALNPQGWFFALAVLGAFFSYEVSRKLDPSAHELQRTYLAVYGIKKVFLILLVCNAVAAIGAQGLGLGLWMWWAEVLVLASAIRLFKSPSAFKLTEGLATLSLLFHIWGIAFSYWLGLLR